MLDNVVICKKFGVLLKCYKEFKQLAKELSIDEYLKDIIKRRAVLDINEIPEHITVF